MFHLMERLNMHSLKAISLLLLFLLGCSEATRKEIFPTRAEGANRILYVKDTRTGLCFVSNEILTDINSVVLTNVPCTPEVEKLLLK